MKVNITYSVSLEEIREKVSDLGLDAIEPLHGHLKILTEALVLHQRRQIPTKSFMDMLDTFRTTLATIDGSLQEVSQLTKGLLDVDNAVASALNPPQSSAPPVMPPTQNYTEQEAIQNLDKGQDIISKIEELKQRVEKE